jgi:D-arabinose 1-dehydrogenase-like Zn-dependent alcohol dehydrogenase
MRTMKAIQVRSPGASFELVQKAIPEPKENEVLIRIEACGVCHGDAVVKEGHFPGIEYPRIPGHEVVGKISKLGPKVFSLETGQRVGVGWYGGPCLKCSPCNKGELFNCQSPLTTAISFDGGYAEYMTAHVLALTTIPDELDSLEAAPLLCAGRTTFTALRGSGAKGGDTVAIQGIGGLGHLAVQFSRKLGFKTIAISRGEDKKKLAYTLGAHAYIDAGSANAAEELKKLGGAKVIIATAPSSKAISELINGLGLDGQMIIVAAPRDPMQIHPGQLLQGRRSIRGWTARFTRDITENAINFSIITGVRPMIEVFPLEHASQAYERMTASQVHFRSVLKIAD